MYSFTAEVEADARVGQWRRRNSKAGIPCSCSMDQSGNESAQHQGRTVNLSAGHSRDKQDSGYERCSGPPSRSTLNIEISHQSHIGDCKALYSTMDVLRHPNWIKKRVSVLAASFPGTDFRFHMISSLAPLFGNKAVGIEPGDT